MIKKGEEVNEHRAEVAKDEEEKKKKVRGVVKSILSYEEATPELMSDFLKEHP